MKNKNVQELSKEELNQMILQYAEPISVARLYLLTCTGIGAIGLLWFIEHFFGKSFTSEDVHGAAFIILWIAIMFIYKYVGNEQTRLNAVIELLRKSNVINS